MTAEQMLKRGRTAVATLGSLQFADVCLGVLLPTETLRELARVAGGVVHVQVYPAQPDSWMPARRAPYVIETWEEGEHSAVKLRAGSDIRPATAEEAATLEVAP